MNDNLYNLEAEQSVIGTIVLDSNYLRDVINIIPTPLYFYDPINIAIYRCCLEMFDNGEKIDFVTVMSKLPTNINLNVKMIKDYLLDAVKIVPSMSRVTKYATIVKEKFKLRELLRLSENIQTSLKNNPDLDRIFYDVNSTVEEIQNGVESKPTYSLENAIDAAFSVQCSECIHTGFADLDYVLGGLKKSDLIFLAARPGMGKTSFALSIAKSISKKYKTLFFSLEMSKEQLSTRLLVMESGLEIEKIQKGFLNNDEWIRLKNTLEILSSCQLVIDDQSNINVQEIKAKAKNCKDIKAIFIDYLQLISPVKSKESRVQEITEITRKLKILAKDINVPVICLSQLSRSSEQRQEHRPILSDLRDSGSIEQDADIVMMLYREFYYNKEEKVDPEESECIIAKNRYGESKTVKLKWEGKYTRFSDYLIA